MKILRKYNCTQVSPSYNNWICYSYYINALVTLSFSGISFTWFYYILYNMIIFNTCVVLIVRIMRVFFFIRAIFFTFVNWRMRNLKDNNLEEKHNIVELMCCVKYPVICNRMIFQSFHYVCVMICHQWWKLTKFHVNLRCQK